MSKAWLLILVVLIGAIGAGLYYTHAKDKAMEEETSAFVTGTVAAISKHWSANELAKRAEPGLLRAMASQGQGAQQLFDIYRKLGPLQGEPDCRLKDTTEFSGPSGSYTSASYTCTAQYEKASADILITVRRGKAQEDWKVYYLNVSSPYFTEQGYLHTK